MVEVSVVPRNQWRSTDKILLFNLWTNWGYNLWSSFSIKYQGGNRGKPWFLRLDYRILQLISQHWSSNIYGTLGYTCTIQHLKFTLEGRQIQWPKPPIFRASSSALRHAAYNEGIHSLSHQWQSKWIILQLTKSESDDNRFSWNWKILVWICNTQLTFMDFVPNADWHPLHKYASSILTTVSHGDCLWV
jgi:hypothetical protein